jgi:hypothetical protein
LDPNEIFCKKLEYVCNKKIHGENVCRWPSFSILKTYLRNIPLNTFLFINDLLDQPILKYEKNEETKELMKSKIEKKSFGLKDYSRYVHWNMNYSKSISFLKYIFPNENDTQEK